MKRHGNGKIKDRMIWRLDLLNEHIQVDEDFLSTLEGFDLDGVVWAGPLFPPLANQVRHTC